LCGIDVDVDDDQVLRVRGVAEDPLSAGYTCPKGRALPAFHHHPDRLDFPLVMADGEQHATTWKDALKDLGSRLQDVIESVGPDGVAVYLATGSAFDASGRRIADRLVRAIGSRSRYTSGSLDTPCKPMVSLMMGGHPGLNPTIDWEGTTMTVLIGSNPVVSHGHVSPFVDPVRRLRALGEQGEVWVVDPRRNETAGLATRHLPVRPGSDYALLAYAVRELMNDGADEEYLTRYATSEDVATLRTAVEPFDLARVTRTTGLPPEDVTDFVAAIRRHGRFAGLTGTGSTMSPAANSTEWLLWALLIITGSFDQPGGMWFNPGYLRQLDTRSWDPDTGEPGPGPASRPELPRWIDEYPSAALLDEIESGNVRALIVLGGNPMTAFPETDRTMKALERLDVLAVADVIETATTRIATHVLPSAGQLERADLPVFVDQFHSIVATRYTEAVVPPGEDRKPLWWIMGSIGAQLGHNVLPDGVTLDSTDDDLLRGLGERSRSGSFAAIKQGGLDNIADEPIVFGWVLDRLPEGRWRLAPAPVVEQLATMDVDPELTLIAHRRTHHLNSQLADHPRLGPPRITMHPDDATERGLRDGEPVLVTSNSGALEGPLLIDDRVRRGSVTVPHGIAELNVGRLTSMTFGVDPLTGMVQLSSLPVEVVAAQRDEGATV
jgi:anaerobic selenocysteine-containing dehydrogenase